MISVAHSPQILHINAPLDAARSFLRRLHFGTRLLVALSGGSDSKGLLVAFHQVLQEPEFDRFTLLAVTVDHALRRDSAVEAVQMSDFCAFLGIEHVTKVWASNKPKSGISQAAREARYRLLSEAAHALKADMILLGHTIGDQRETIAMRAERTVSADAIGLAGMAEATLIHGAHWACRPFLAIERCDIRTYLTHKGEGWIDDPSNASRAYERVRVREQLDGVSAGIDPRLAELRFDLSQAAAIWLETAFKLHPNFLISLEREAVLQKPAVAQYALAYLAAIIGGRAYPMSRDATEKLMQLAATGSGRMSAHRVTFDVRKNRVYLYRERRNLPESPTAQELLMVWDERLRISRALDGNLACDVSTNIDSAVPQSLIRAAQAALPVLHGDAASAPSNHRIEMALRPFDQFLPLFDYAYAQAVARCFGLPAYPAPPISNLRA